LRLYAEPRIVSPMRLIWTLRRAVPVPGMTT
jgi:hypothetical protein